MIHVSAGIAYKENEIFLPVDRYTEKKRLQSELAKRGESAISQYDWFAFTDEILSKLFQIIARDYSEI